MTSKVPGFEIRAADHLGVIRRLRDPEAAVRHVEEWLASPRVAYPLDEEHLVRWLRRQGDAGRALAALFGRLAELVWNRLGQIGDKHFLAFLNAAGVDLLPPRAASAELTFLLPEDGPGLVRVPAGTQVATAQTETRPEVVFETVEDLVVAPNELVKCVAFDAVEASDRTDLATGAEAGSFPVFQGQTERQRILYLGGGDLFAFDDDASREHATLTFHFAAETLERDADGGGPAWEHYDPEGEVWKAVPGALIVADTTAGLTRAGVVAIASPPALEEHTLSDGAREWTSRWLRARWTGGKRRSVLPVLDTVRVARSIDLADHPDRLAPDLGFYNPVQTSTFAPLDFSKEVYPLGIRPQRFDAFYLAADEPLSKPGATVTLEVKLASHGFGATDADTVFAGLELVWEIYDGTAWQELGRSTRAAGASGLTDPTRALTVSGTSTISFKVPEDHPPQRLAVNDQEHYWLRVRLANGRYYQEGSWQEDDGTRGWVPEKLYPPILESLTLGYSFTAATEPADLDVCLGEVDSAFTDHTRASREEGSAFAPFRAADEGPALYLGFRAAFPAGEWVRLLLDVEETGAAEPPPVFWEYWNGSGWRALRASDATQGLTRRGFLGYFAPADHRLSTEFGQAGYWLKARPPRPPRADAGDDLRLVVTADEGTATLDASGSEAFDARTVAGYRWRRVSSSRLPAADAGADLTVTVAGQEATVTLDASGSMAAPDRQIVDYAWSRVEAPDAPEEEPATAAPTPYLRTVRVNSVEAINAITVEEEILGASDGKAGQIFTLLRPPVLPGAVLAVREPDRPPEEELAELLRELRQADEDAAALLAEVWVRWHEVPDFYLSTPASRHFVLDAITGEVRFGDGEHGMIPPAGLDNVKMVRYRTHGGARGNANAGEVNVLRNPSGDLADVESVVNPEAAAGGSDEETTAEVMVRGPLRLKHRERAVTVQDYEALTLEVSSEVAAARCLPGVNRQGLTEAGWVTVVVLPRSTEAKPTPRASLLRRVRSHLEDHALTNLEEGGQINVRGPDYVRTVVKAKVVAEDPTRADEVELDVIARLESFLHPLTGGPDRSGWTLGRDVYLSEVYAEIESVSGVDHVPEARLVGSLQQLRLIPEKPFRSAPFRLPEGSPVATFDERLMLRLARPVERGEELRELRVYGFRTDGVVDVLRHDGSVVEASLVIGSLAGDRVVFTRSFVDPGDRGWTLRSEDGLLRLPVADVEADDDGAVSAVRLERFTAGRDRVSVAVGRQRHSDLEWIALSAVADVEDRIFVPVGHLPFSGDHDVEMVIGE